MSGEAWGDGDDGFDAKTLIESGWLSPDDATELQEKLSASESRYTESVRQWGEDMRRVEAWRPIVFAACSLADEDPTGNMLGESFVAMCKGLPEGLRPAGEKA